MIWIRFIFCLGMLQATSLLAAGASVQSHPHSSPLPRNASPAGNDAAEIAQLLLLQQRALDSGDPATIAQATKPLAARLLVEMARIRFAQGNVQAGVDLYHRSLELQPSPKLRLEFASVLLKSSRPQEAASETLNAVQADPQNASAWALRGTALRASGKEIEAVDAFRHALQLRPDPGVAYALGSALLAIHEKEKAEQIFAQILAGSGNAAIWHVAIGDAYRENLYLDEAVVEFKKAIAIDPRVGHSEFFLGLTYLQLNQWGPSSQSFEHLRAAVKQAPREYISNFYLGALESTVGSDLASSNQHLRVAAEANPKSAEVWLYLGLNAVREKRIPEAKVYLRKAVQLTGPNEDQNNYQIRRVYAVLGRILISEGNHAEGDALLARYKRAEQRSIENSSNAIAQSAESDLARSAASGVAAAKASFPGMNSPTSAGLETSGALSAPASRVDSPQTPEQKQQLASSEQKLGELLASSFNDLGSAEARQGNFGLALSEFQEAERWHAPAPTLLHNLGVAAFRNGDFKESARALDLYLKNQQSSAAAPAQDSRSHMMLAMSLFNLGEFARADQAFTAVSSQTLQDPRAAYSWAYSLAHSGKQQRANEIASELSGQGLPSDVMSLVCHLFMDTESYEQSVTCFKRAYQSDPNLKLAHYQVAESLIRLDRPGDAIPELRQELTMTPDDPDVQYLLAFALLQTSHKEEALTILQGLTSSHPNHAQAQYQLGKLLLEQGQSVEAVKHLELAEQNDPAPDYIHYQLQAAYRKAGRVEDADRELRVYRELKAKNRDVSPPK